MGRRIFGRGFSSLAVALALAVPSAPALAAADGEPPKAAGDATRGDVDAARAHYQAGVHAYEAQRYPEAIAEFRTADRLAPRAALSYNVARAYDALGDTARALEFYRDYLRRDAAAANAGTTRARIGELETLLAQRGVQQLSVSSEPSGASLRIDERLVGKTPWTGELPPGPHRLTLVLPGRPEVTRAIELPAGRALAVELDVTSSPPAPVAPSAAPAPAAATAPAPARVAREPARVSFGPWPYVALGAGGLGLLGSLGFELARRGSESDAENASHRDYGRHYDRMESQEATARVLLGVGGALALTGGVLLLLEQRQRPTAQAACSLLARGCVVEGRF